MSKPEREDVIRMAREAGIEFQENTGIAGRVRTSTCGSQSIEKIEALILAAVEAEREACAKFCETNQVWVGRGKRGFSEWGHEDFVTGGRHQGMDYADAIRARGQV